MAILKRQLEEKEKLLATEQEDAAVAKSKLRELNKVQPKWAQRWLVLPHPLRTPRPVHGVSRALRCSGLPGT